MIISLKSLETSIPRVMQAMTFCTVCKCFLGSLWTSGLRRRLLQTHHKRSYIHGTGKSSSTHWSTASMKILPQFSHFTPFVLSLSRHRDVRAHMTFHPPECTPGPAHNMGGVRVWRTYVTRVTAHLKQILHCIMVDAPAQYIISILINDINV